MYWKRIIFRGEAAWDLTGSTAEKTILASSGKHDKHKLTLPPVHGPHADLSSAEPPPDLATGIPDLRSGIPDLR